MYEFTPIVIAIYALALVVLYCVELFMFWAGCAIGDQEPPSWLTSFVVVLPVFAVSVILFELVCRAESILPRFNIKADVPALMEFFGIGQVPFAVVVASLVSWVIALILYIPVVTKFSFYKGFWVATSEVLFRSVVVMLIAAVSLVFGATYQVNVAKPKPESPGVVKPS